MKNKQRPPISTTLFPHHISLVPGWVLPLSSLALVRWPTQAQGPEKCWMTFFRILLLLTSKVAFWFKHGSWYRIFCSSYKNEISISSVVLVSKQLAKVTVRMTWIRAKKKKKEKNKTLRFLWEKIDFKMFNTMLYGIPHLLFLHFSWQ